MEILESRISSEGRFGKIGREVKCREKGAGKGGRSLRTPKR